VRTSGIDKSSSPHPVCGAPHGEAEEALGRAGGTKPFPNKPPSSSSPSMAAHPLPELEAPIDKAANEVCDPLGVSRGDVMTLSGRDGVSLRESVGVGVSARLGGSGW
jgi:hypothetical protein